MGSIAFFAVDRNKLTHELADATLPVRVAKHVSERREQVSADDLQVIQNIVESVQGGKWTTEEAPSDVHTSFLWTLDLLCEKLNVPFLRDFKREHLIIRLPLLEVFWQGSPPFPVPHFEGKRLVGSVPWEEMQGLLSYLNSEAGQGRLAQSELAIENQILDLMESLSQDCLDMLAATTPI